MNRTGERFDSRRFLSDVDCLVTVRGLSYRRVLTDVGISIGAGYAVIRGERPPSLHIVCALADWCGLSLDDYRVCDEIDQLIGDRDQLRARLKAMEAALTYAVTHEHDDDLDGLSG